MEKNLHTRKKNLIIIGSGGHGRVIKDIASVPGFVPETIRKTFRVLGNSDHAI